jgi:predicted PolB exonuclease-like 3'-5' exonuclease
VRAARRHGFKVASVGTPDDDEPELVRRFFDLIDKHTPQLVSWNGGGFDLPVLNYRALIHGVTARKYWDWGDDDREFKFNSYLGRYHTRHLDLMDVLAMYQPRARAGLDAIARLCGYPGKLGWTAARCTRPSRRASSTTCAAIARPTS